MTATRRGEQSLERYEQAVSLGRFARDLTRDAVPAEVWSHAKTVTLDTIGCTVGGSTAAPVTALIELTASLAGTPEATVLGTDITTDCVSAASTNAYVSDVLDFEDTLVSHPSAAIVPAALAVGERLGATGAEVLLAVIAGYEVGLRVGDALLPPLMPGHSGLGTVWLPFASVAAAGTLLGLDDSGWANALGYAGRTTPLSQPSLHAVRPLSWVKGNWHAITYAGVFAALLAHAGFQARTPMLEQDGLLARMLGSDSWRPEAVTAGLGESWMLGETTLKPYPCCRYIHPTLDAIEEIMGRQPIAADDVASVVVRSSDHVASNFSVYRPAEMIDAQFSVPYSVSMMLLGYPYGPRWHDPENRADPAVHAIADRVRVEESNPYTDAHARGRYGSTVEVTLRDGQTLSAEREHPRGGREEPVTDEETGAKFRNLCEPILGEDATERAYGLLAALDEAEDVRTVTAVLRPGG